MKLRELIPKKSDSPSAYFAKVTLLICSTTLCLVLFFSLVVCSLWIVVNSSQINQFVEAIELKTLDVRFNHRLQPVKHNDDIVIVNIDDTSLEILEEEFGGWAWPREIHGTVAQAFSDAGAKAIIFDLIFIGHHKGFEEQDVEMAEIFSSLDNVYIGISFDSREERNNIETLNEIEKLAIKTKNCSNIDFSKLKYSNCRAIYPELLRATKNIGLVNSLRDNDGIHRRHPLLSIYHNYSYPHLALKVAMDIIADRTKKPVEELVITEDNHLIVGDTKIPLQNDGKMLINWYGPAQTYTYIPMWRVIRSIQQMENGEPPMIDLKNTFDGKIVFIGSAASGLQDIKTTPFSRIFPGVEIHATVLNNILSGDFLTRAPWYLNLLICLILSVLTGACILITRSPIVAFFITLGITAVYLTIAILVFSYLSLWINIVYPVLVILITFPIVHAIKQIKTSR